MQKFWLEKESRISDDIELNPLIIQSSGQSVKKWMDEQLLQDHFRRLHVLDLSEKPSNLSDEDYDIFKRDFDNMIGIYIPSIIPAPFLAGLEFLIKVR